MARVTLFYYGPDFYVERWTEIITLRGRTSIYQGTHFDVPSVEVEVFSGFDDFEGDSCRLARFIVQLAQTDLSWYPERLSIKGFLSELEASPRQQKNVHDGGWAYMPKPDLTFRPGLVEVVIEN